MRFAALGRTSHLLRSVEALIGRGHQLVLIATAKAEPYYGASERNFQALAQSKGLDLLLTPSSAELARLLPAARAEVAVSVNWPVILSEDACASVPLGILNAHAGDLPRYRGNAAPNWAILRGEDHIGLCVHIMEPGSVDSGPIVLRDRLPLLDTTYIADCYAWLDKTIPGMFLQALDGLADGSIRPQPQPTDKSLALRCYPRRAEDARIDWSLQTVAIHRLIRASSHPLQGAYCWLEGERRVTIWRAELYEHPGPFLSVPGQVLLRVDGNPVIACGDGTIRLTDVEVEGFSGNHESQRAIGSSLRNRLT